MKEKWQGARQGNQNLSPSEMAGRLAPRRLINEPPARGVAARPAAVPRHLRNAPGCAIRDIFPVQHATRNPNADLSLEHTVRQGVMHRSFTGFGFHRPVSRNFGKLPPGGSVQPDFPAGQCGREADPAFGAPAHGWESGTSDIRSVATYMPPGFSFQRIGRKRPPSGSNAGSVRRRSSPKLGLKSTAPGVGCAFPALRCARTWQPFRPL